MRYLADTSYLIDLVNGDRGAVELAEELDVVGEEVGLSVISVEEYIRGIYHLYLNSDILEEKLRAAKRDVSAFEILPITYEVALKAAEVDAMLAIKGEMLSLADVLIATTAIINNLVLVTRNVRHFKRIPNVKVRRY
ncbi:MAG: type II toxin-antitoxin system VapC family toxin [Candidatus Freyarchaeota archaeon]